MSSSHSNIPAANNHFIVDNAEYSDNTNVGVDNRQIVYQTQQLQEPQPKKRNSLLEKLIFLGKVEKEIEIDGIKFVISTLTNKDNMEITKEVYNGTDQVDFTAIRTMTLAQSIKSIDGIPIDQIQIDANFSSSLYKRKAIVDLMQLTIINRIMEEYDKLRDESEQISNNEEIKK